MTAANSGEFITAREKSGLIVGKVDEQTLNNRITELEEQLAACKAALLTLQSPTGFSIDKHFRLLFTHSRDIILFVDRSNGRILDANAAAIHKYGYTYEELLALSIHEIRAGSTKHLTAEQMSRADAEGILFETEHRCKNGSIFPVEVSSQGATIDDQRFLISVVRDITERKRAETALNQYATELERSNRELQEFAFVASHDLQEPLRKIEAFSDILLEESTRLTNRQIDLLNRLKNSALRMRSMVVGLLHLSRLSTEAQPFQQVDLNEVIAEVLSDLDRSIQLSGGTVETSHLPVLEADPLQIYQLLQNLVGNALKFQPKGGKPYIKVFAEQPDNGSVNILVKDNGIGFDAEHADHLFQPFRRFVSRRKYEGSGMGLAICRKIVERHAGKINVDSHPGEGATFIVTLPLHQDPQYYFPGVF